jgi:hypothetical protein
VLLAALLRINTHKKNGFTKKGCERTNENQRKLVERLDPLNSVSIWNCFDA